MPVAAARNVLQGEVRAAQDLSRWSGKRRKDLLDTERLIESDPSLRELMPEEIYARPEL